jgi:hypothetical protein
MIYLFSQQEGSEYEHNFYDVITNTHHAVSENTLYILYPGDNSYVLKDQICVDYYPVVDESINIIIPKFSNFEERMKFISNIIEQKIFENI